MTLVVAQQFGQRIVVHSDTMISDLAGGRPLLIPGRLKAITLSKEVSVAYAGYANPCIDTVRNAYSALIGGASFGEFLDLFRSESATDYAGSTNDFLVASHAEVPSLLVFKKGRQITPTGPVFLGDAVAFDRVMGQVKPLQVTETGFASAQEMQLSSAFCALFSDGPFVQGGVGGAPFNLLASPYGHTYQPYAASVVFNDFLSSNPIFETVMSDRARKQATGEIEWSISTYGTGVRGVPVAGMHLRQINHGFIYLPLQFDEAISIPNCDLSLFCETMEWKARELDVNGRIS